MKRSLLQIGMITFFMTLHLNAFALTDKETQALSTAMDHSLDSLRHKGGWPIFIKEHSTLFAQDDFVGMGELTLTVDDKVYKVPMGCRSVFIDAPPKNVVSAINTPQLFMPLYGLDKPSEKTSVDPDGSFQARIYKLVPGIETQDYTLQYRDSWEGQTWLGQARQVRDDRKFALRENFKIIEPIGKGSLFREVALFFPLRWWVKLFPDTLQKTTKRELGKLNKTVKCASEKITETQPLTEEIAKTCHKQADP